MTPSQAVGLLGILLLSGGLSYALVRLALDPDSVLRVALRGYEDKLEAELAFLRKPGSGQRIIVLQFAAFVLAALLASGASKVFALLLPVVVFAPLLQMRSLRERRVVRIEQQLDGWLLVLANAIKAVPAIGDALASSQALMHAPISEELDVALKEYRLGTPLDRALQNMGDRVGSRVVRTALTILQVARRTGGNLSLTLESSAASLRELARLEGVVRTKTADGRNQAFVIGALPGVLIVLLYFVHPDLLVPLVDTFMGNVLLTISIALWIGAIALALRILKVDI